MYLLQYLFQRKSAFKRWKQLLLGLVTLATVSWGVACSPSGSFNPQSAASAAMPEEVRIGYQVIPNAEVLAKSLGLVEKKFPETKIKWTAFPAGWKINAAMLEGEVDIGMVGSLPVSTAIAQSLPLHVYIVHNIIDKNAALAVTQASKIKAISDLPGKVIGVPFGSTSHFSLLSALAQANIKSTDVTILDMSISELLSAWERDAIDGSFVWQTTLSKLLRDNGTAVITAGDLADKGGLTADLGTVSDEFLADYPEFLTQFIDVLDEATQLYRDDPVLAANTVAKDVSLSPAETLSVMNEILWLDIAQQSDPKYMGMPQSPGGIAQVLKDSAAFMAKQDAIPPEPELETFQQALFNQPFAR